ncbi:hypothetical protein Tdes44962_MAKER08363 [Teratosphaeria destructans]|uniref:Uncharacterized protein n=1 Tax=Teratosphaeria destructans TaxID=418781 RepID=A0A9W7SWR0_9PEZI|nr:hypothetical protein Tdes44962_MAKER08363 [Teratosphaeria destructans]
MSSPPPTPTDRITALEQRIVAFKQELRDLRKLLRGVVEAVARLERLVRPEEGGEVDGGKGVEERRGGGPREVGEGRGSRPREVGERMRADGWGAAFLGRADGRTDGRGVLFEERRGGGGR